MSRGKHLSLEEARRGETRGATIKRFCKEHPSQGNGDLFDRLLDEMVKPKSSPKAHQTSVPGSDEDCT